MDYDRTAWRALDVRARLASEFAFRCDARPGNYLWSNQPIRKPRRYEVTSYPEVPNNRLHSREREPLLQVPASISPAVRALARSWKGEKAEPRAVVKKALEFFHTQGFQYSPSPGQYGKNDLDDFLFHRRLGFCEHYAASFATLMRLAGIPARVVTGYLGGEYNEIGHFFLVREADAHAWCEVWFPDSGWERVDPTAVVAPDRVNLGLNFFLERRAATGQLIVPKPHSRDSWRAGRYSAEPGSAGRRLVMPGTPGF